MGSTLLTVETEVDGYSQSTNERVHSLVGSLGFGVPVQEIFVLPRLFSSAQVLNIFFLTVHYFQFLCPHRPASWADSRAGSPVS
jgi:hypothetical protein